MSLSLTELRTKLFALADHVIESGEPLLIERRGVRLRLVREDAQAESGRLSRLAVQSLTLGAPLAPDESPAEWTGFDYSERSFKAAEPQAHYLSEVQQQRVLPGALLKRQRRGAKKRGDPAP